MVTLPEEWADQKCQGTDNLWEQLLANSCLELGYKCPASTPFRRADSWGLCGTVCRGSPVGLIPVAPSGSCFDGSPFSTCLTFLLSYQNGLNRPNKYLFLSLLSGSASGGPPCLRLDENQTVGTYTRDGKGSRE